MSADRLALEWIPGRYAVCQLPPTMPVPAWADVPGSLAAVTRTDQELSIIVPEESVPPGVRAVLDRVAIRVVGSLDFSVIGVLSALTGALADARVPVLAISTYRTDILLIKATDAPRAVKALAAVADVRRLDNHGDHGGI